MIPCTIAQRHLTKPDGGVELCWVVTAIEPEGEATAVFSGHDACARAEAYARSRYKPIHRSMMAEPGRIFSQGAPMGGVN